MTDTTTLPQAAVGGRTTTLAAYDGKTGRRLWQHAYTAMVDGLPAPEGVAELDDVLTNRAGRASSLLLSYRTKASERLGDVLVQPAVVSGADGAVVTSGKAITAVHTKLQDPRVAAVGDLDGDGLADYGVAVAGTFEARSAATGHPLWTSPAGAPTFLSVPDTNGDGVPEVLVTHTLRDGRTGAARFAMPGNEQRVAGNADGDGHADLLDNTQDTKFKSLRFACTTVYTVVSSGRDGSSLRTSRTPASFKVRLVTSKATAYKTSASPPTAKTAATILCGSCTW